MTSRYDETCLLCRLADEEEFEPYVVFKNTRWTLVTDPSQFHLGQMLLIYRGHVSDAGKLPDRDGPRVNQFLQRARDAATKAFEPVDVDVCELPSHARKEYRHVHWILYPRYDTPPVFEGVEHPDPNPGGGPLHDAVLISDRKTRCAITEALRAVFI